MTLATVHLVHVSRPSTPQHYALIHCICDWHGGTLQIEEIDGLIEIKL